MLENRQVCSIVKFKVKTYLLVFLSSDSWKDRAALSMLEGEYEGKKICDFVG